jgi:TIR domain
MTPTVFISYSHRDEVWRDELVRRLRVSQRAGELRISDTSELQVGGDWSAEISGKLNQADLAVILMSPDALASDFMVEKEFPVLLRRQRAGEIVFLPVLLRQSLWTALGGFAELQFANNPSKPLANLSPADRETAFAQIAERISTLARAIAQRKQDSEAGERLPRPEPSNTEAPKLCFVSHAHEDGDFAEWLKLNLEKNGETAWIDTDRLLPGIDWRLEIDDTIRQGKAVIAIMSPEARASEYVTYEWAFAWGCNKKIIPIMLRETSLHPRLATLQYLDFSDRLSRPWDRLYKTIKMSKKA